MKKPKSINRIIKVIEFLMILTYILTGCSNKSNQKNEILWGTDFVKADAYINDVMYKEFGLEIPFAYTGEITDVELVSIEGENTQAISFGKFIYLHHKRCSRSHTISRNRLCDGGICYS